MMSTDVEQLEYRINQMRKNLILTVKETGLNSTDTLYYSQKLDELIMRYQKLKMNEIQKFDHKSRIVT